MKVKLELDEYRFGTLDYPFGETTRYLAINIAGKPFMVCRVVERDTPWHRDHEWVDKLLVEMAEAMVAKILASNAAAIPDGTQII